MPILKLHVVRILRDIVIYLVKLGVAECAGKFVLEAKEAARIIVRHIGQSVVVSGRWQADTPRAIILNVAVIKCMQAADHR